MYVSDHTRAIVGAIAERVRFVQNDALAYRAPSRGVPAPHAYLPAETQQQWLQHQAALMAGHHHDHSGHHHHHYQQQNDATPGGAHNLSDVNPALAAAANSRPGTLGSGRAHAYDVAEQKQSPMTPPNNSNKAGGNNSAYVIANTFANSDRMTTAQAKSKMERRDIVDYAMRRVASVPPVTRVAPSGNNNRRGTALTAFRESLYRNEPSQVSPSRGRSIVEDILMRGAEKNGGATGGGGGRYYANSSSYGVSAASRSYGSPGAAAVAAGLQPPVVAPPANNAATNIYRSSLGGGSSAPRASSTPGVSAADPALRMGSGYDTFNRQELTQQGPGQRGVGVGTERYIMRADHGVDRDAMRRAVEYTAQTRPRSAAPQGSVRPMTMPAPIPRQPQRDSDDEDEGDDDLEELPYRDALAETQPDQQRNKEREPLSASEILSEAQRLGLRVPGQAQMEQNQTRGGGGGGNTEFLTSAAANDFLFVGDRAAFQRNSQSPQRAGSTSSARDIRAASSAHYDTQTAGLSQAKLLNERIEARANRILGSQPRRSASASAAAPTAASRSWVGDRAAYARGGAASKKDYNNSNGATSLRSAAYADA